MSERLVFDERPPKAERLALCDWLRIHGIDPDDLVLPCWVERDVENYRVRYLGAVRDENGKLQPAPGGEVVVTAEQYVQLEGPPLPFPAVA